MRILVVDDDEELADTVAVGLRRARMAVDVAYDGAAALERALANEYEVVVLDRHRYPAMETSFANGGQLSVSNAEVWNSPATLLKGLKWMFDAAAPLSMSLAPSWHKYSWLAEFVAQIPRYRENTLATVRLALDARRHLFAIAENDDMREPKAKDVLRKAFDDAHGHAKAEIEVYTGTMHGWCPTDASVYNHDQAEKAWSRQLATFKTALA